MAYITRDDGVQFVVPSYRDVITMRSAGALKKEIYSLSSNYGEYITMQQKGAIQYEVAFSPDTGYLLGESIWHQFKRPMDLVYCEVVPNTSEAILVIVVSGSVYLDGRFQTDSIPDELVVFLTQKNKFDIYTYGDVPISQEAEIGKFSFEADSVKSFTVLDKPVFAELPLLRMYQLQLVDTVLKENKIGTLPLRKIALGVIIAGMLFLMWNLMSSGQDEVKAVVLPEVNPYIAFNKIMTSPAPDQEMQAVLKAVDRLFTMPGWTIIQMDYVSKAASTKVTSGGTSIAVLQNWAMNNEATVDINKAGIFVVMPIKITDRKTPTKIYPTKSVVMTFIDRIATVYPGNNVRFSSIDGKGIHKTSKLEITIDKLTPVTLGLISEQFKDLPLVLKGVSLKLDRTGTLSGKILIEAVGS